jgi:hypothetical protein
MKLFLLFPTIFIFFVNNIIVSLGHGCFQNNKIITQHIVWGHWIAPNAS